MPEGRRWFEQRKEFTVKAREPGAEISGVWHRCPECAEVIFGETLTANLEVCTKCEHHFRIGSIQRLESLADEGSLEYRDRGLSPVDALEFVDSKPYKKRIDSTRKASGMNDAYLAASAKITGIPVEIGSFEFGYMGGSMGSVVGEAITRQVERAIAAKCPAIVVSASGGARMQEGVLSLMQMAKTSAALARLKDEARMPYISVLTHPTTGGVAASFAMLGDVILAEPKSLVGFAGPRVIEQTIGQSLPEGFQTAEYLLDHGLVDQIVHRRELRRTIAIVLRQLLRMPSVDEATA
jgi:acetyl-CoA carboxylase carboxyl transferase subunit beta